MKATTSMDLAGSTILITGATRGIGRALTRQSIELGATVVAVGRDRSRLAALAAEHPGRVSVWPADLADPDAVDALIAGVSEQHPGLGAVINNAAVQEVTDLLDGDVHTVRPILRREIRTNLDAVVALSTGFLPVLRGQPAAAVVNITTGLALAPKRSAPIYCATKAGVRTFTRALRYQCQAVAPHIQVVEAMMPLVDTDMTRGRGSGKISAAEAAAAVLAGVRRGSTEIRVGKTRMLPALMRLSPALGYRALRDS